jgi:hypothetical protein
MKAGKNLIISSLHSVEYAGFDQEFANLKRLGVYYFDAMESLGDFTRLMRCAIPDHMGLYQRRNQKTDWRP